MLKAVIFDMDGVLVDSEPLHFSAYQKMFKDYQLEVSETLYQSFTGQATLEICQQLVDKFNLKLGLKNSWEQNATILSNY